jgi:hypothetical protein
MQPEPAVQFRNSLENAHNKPEMVVISEFRYRVSTMQPCFPLPVDVLVPRACRQQAGIDIEVPVPSQSAAAGVTIKGSESNASSKFEVDTTASVTAYSRSTKQDFSSSKNLNKLKDVKDLYPTATGLSVTGDAPMTVVSGLTIYEKTYDGATSDLGQQAAEFSVSLWYLNASATTPAVAEASFKVEEKNGDFTNKVTQRSELVFTTMTQMASWVAPTATPKTTWVYQYDPSFCNSPAPAGAAQSSALPF